MDSVEEKKKPADRVLFVARSNLSLESAHIAQPWNAATGVRTKNQPPGGTLRRNFDSAMCKSRELAHTHTPLGVAEVFFFCSSGRQFQTRTRGGRLGS